MEKCKNCGADYGLHHYQTDQCPVGGIEAPIGQKQEWKTSTYEEQLNPSYEELLTQRDQLKKALETLLKQWNDLEGTLNHKNHSVFGWHMNDDGEPIENFFNDNDLNAVEKAEQALKSLAP